MLDARIISAYSVENGDRHPGRFPQESGRHGSGRIRRMTASQGHPATSANIICPQVTDCKPGNRCVSANCTRHDPARPLEAISIMDAVYSGNCGASGGQSGASSAEYGFL